MLLVLCLGLCSVIVGCYQCYVMFFQCYVWVLLVLYLCYCWLLSVLCLGLCNVMVVCYQCYVLVYVMLWLCVVNAIFHCTQNVVVYHFFQFPAELRQSVVDGNYYMVRRALAFKKYGLDLQDCNGHTLLMLAVLGGGYLF